jgi:tetratricopeptide (TPR) repeat protein
VALGRSGASAKIVPVAEKALAHFPENEDLLMVMADSASSRKQSERAAGYAERLIGVLDRHGKPEGVSAADWDRKRINLLGRAHWIAGIAHSEKNQYAEADKDLRAALPVIQGNESMAGPALFYLGIANYQIGKLTLNKARVLEAAAFSEKAAAIAGPFSQQAWRNVAAMKKEAGAMR